MFTALDQQFSNYRTLACKVGKRGGLEKCGQDMEIYSFINLENSIAFHFTLFVVISYGPADYYDPALQEELLKLLPEYPTDPNEIWPPTLSDGARRGMGFTNWRVLFFNLIVILIH